MSSRTAVWLTRSGHRLGVIYPHSPGGRLHLFRWTEQRTESKGLQPQASKRSLVQMWFRDCRQKRVFGFLLLVRRGSRLLIRDLGEYFFCFIIRVYVYTERRVSFRQIRTCTHRPGIISIPFPCPSPFPSLPLASLVVTPLTSDSVLSPSCNQGAKHCGDEQAAVSVVTWLPSAHPAGACGSVWDHTVTEHMTASQGKY